MRMKIGDIEHLNDTIALGSYVFVFRGKEEVEDANVIFCEKVNSHNFRIQTKNSASLAKWLSVHLRTKWLWVRVQLQSLKLQILHLLRARSSLTFRQL